MTDPGNVKRYRGWLPREERGSVAIQIGIMMIAILGFLALGIEITYLLLKQREMQSAADSAAMAGATAMSFGFPTDFRMEAKAVASASGFTDGVDETTVTVNSPPLSGPNAGNASAVEVIVRQPQQLSLIRLYRSGLFNVGARAAAVVQPAYMYCILSLESSAPRAVYLNNNVVAANSSCGVAVNSSSSSALALWNNAVIDGPVRVHGDWSLNNNAQLNGTPTLNRAPIIPDPYADVSLQPIPACTSQSGVVSGSVAVTLNPGRFCNGFNISNGATVNLRPGAYYIDKQFVALNTATINGMGGVTLVITGNYAINWGNMMRLNIIAPSTGPYAGIAMFGNRAAPNSIEQVFSNNTYLNVQGVLYFPNQALRFDNNGITGPSQCAQIVARVIQIFNNVALNNNCVGTGVRPIGSLSKLVE